MRHIITFKRTLAALGVLASACSTPGNHRNTPALTNLDPDSSVESHIDISYILGQSHYQIYFQSRDGVAVGRSLVDHETAKDTRLSSEKYSVYLEKVSKFTAAPHRMPAQESTCLSPFFVTLIIGKTTNTVTGCRATEEKDFSQLVQDGEFLLCSKKK